MSGDVTAAIERLRAWAGATSGMLPDFPAEEDIATLIRAVESAQFAASLEEVRADHHRNEHYANSVAMSHAVLRADRAEAEVERLQEECDAGLRYRDELVRLRAERDEIAERADREAAELTVALRDVRDLRAEREALHSDETREQVARIVRDFMQAAGARITTSDRILAARVLSVLSAGSEADQ